MHPQLVCRTDLVAVEDLGLHVVRRGVRAERRADRTHRADPLTEQRRRAAPVVDLFLVAAARRRRRPAAAGTRAPSTGRRCPGRGSGVRGQPRLVRRDPQLRHQPAAVVAEPVAVGLDPRRVQRPALLDRPAVGRRRLGRASSPAAAWSPRSRRGRSTGPSAPRRSRRTRTASTRTCRRSRRAGTARSRSTASNSGRGPCLLGEHHVHELVAAGSAGSATATSYEDSMPFGSSAPGRRLDVGVVVHEHELVVVVQALHRVGRRRDIADHRGARTRRDWHGSPPISRYSSHV